MIRTNETRFTTPSDAEIEITRVIAAPRRLVWAAWTRPEHLPNWLLGPPGWVMNVCEVDLRVGGAWTYQWQGPEGAEMTMRGVYREISPPERLVCTESWGADWPETVSRLTLTEEGGRTTVTIRVVYPSPAARDQALASGMKEGMSAGHDRLEAYLAGLPAST